MSENLIETFDLTKVFELKGKDKTIKALDNVNISIKEGEIFGLLGPNGAGKTTLIQILTSLMYPTSGYATIKGIKLTKHPKHAKSKIALMLGNGMLYYRITAYDNLKFFCKIYKVPYDRERIYNAAKEFGLEDWLDQYVEKFSSGMKTKLALCRTFLLNRPILFLDEPTTGLDVNLKAYMVDKIKSLGKTILFTSHDMSIVEKVCDRIAFINKGKIVKVGNKKDITRFKEKEMEISVDIDEEKDKLMDSLLQESYVKDVVLNNGGLNIVIQKRDYFNNLLLTLGKFKVLNLNIRNQTLEDLFIELSQ